MNGRPPSYQEWQQIVVRRMSHLSKPQACVLAMWSFGMMMTHSCGLSTVSVFLAKLLHKSEYSVREQLRQWYKEGSTQYGRKRSEIDVSRSFIPLLQWVLQRWSADEKQLILAADASSLGERFTLLNISVVYRGCGIPVAWKVITAAEKGSWKPYWLKLLADLKGGIPSDWLVIVTTDRGLYAKWFYEAIVALKWHPFMRINDQGYFQQSHKEDFIPLKGLITSVGEQWAGAVRCFKSETLSCTLLGQWDERYTDPWLILTDLTPQQAQICWYGMRSWIECLFKDIKRGGFQWHQTKMTDPTRAERLWLAIAVATLWLVSVGGSDDAGLPVSTLAFGTQVDSPSNACANVGSTSSPSPKPRLLSCFRRGFLVILAALIRGLPLPQGRFVPSFSPAHG